MLSLPVMSAALFPCTGGGGLFNSERAASMASTLASTRAAAVELCLVLVGVTIDGVPVVDDAAMDVRAGRRDDRGTRIDVGRMNRDAAA